MTAVEWILAAGVVALLWAWALYMMVTEEQPKCSQRPNPLAEEIARWVAAADRTYERQGIRRRR